MYIENRGIMRKKIVVIFLVACFFIVSIGMVNAYGNTSKDFNKNNTSSNSGYGVQWQMSYGSSPLYGARYEGPQPIGDSNNDGKNELLIGGRDATLRVMEWNQNQKTYVQTQTLHCPFYPFLRMDPGGFAIGDLNNDGKNEIAATWYCAIHKWFAGRYWIVACNPWLLRNGGGSADCYIGDCDNDGKNELIVAGGPLRSSSTIPEIAIFKWNGFRLVMVAQWDYPGDGYVYMPGIGDVDEDNENEIVCGTSNKVFVLDWNKETNQFDETIIKSTSGWENYPFACVCKDSDGDGKNEIHVGYYSPRITIFEWDGNSYITKYEKYLPGEGAVIEGLDVGDTDNDGYAEVCVGTDKIHILQWDGSTYVEEALIDETYGDLAVVAVGDCDNDGLNEIHAGAVAVEYGQNFMSWVFKYGWEESSNK